MILPDVNVWISILSGGHEHHGPGSAWIDDQEDEIAFCRVTHMGVLRLLSTPAVMGKDVMTRSQAWQVLDETFLDSRVVFAGEPLNIEPFWRVLSSTDDHSHKLWTDDYLAAFAMAAEIPLVTFDRRIEARYPQAQVMTLG